VGIAAAAAAAVSLVPSMPSIIRAVVALGVYTATILGTRAVPEELRELLPSRLRPR
jgi:hypothetical protein